MLRDLHNHTVVRNAADKWRNLGVQLLRPNLTKELDIIGANHPHNVVRCCECVLEKWLETSTDATWDELIEALKQIQLNHFANELEQRLKSQCKVTIGNVYKLMPVQVYHELILCSGYMSDCKHNNAL